MIASSQNNETVANVKANAKAAIEEACSRLKSAGLRITRPRIAILTVLAERREPASIEQIHSELGPGRCDLVTVYRCIAAFDEINLVRRAFFLEGTCRYEINLGAPSRYPVVCRRTRRVEDLDAETAAELGRTLHAVEEHLRALGYAEVGHLVEFFGIAPAPIRAPE